jgi:hypothetical protein
MDKELKHTPGPWHVDPKRGLRVANEEDYTVASTGCSDSHAHQWYANATLIAAAPELLSSLRGIVNCHECENMLTDSVLQAALDAIAKATA